MPKLVDHNLYRKKLMDGAINVVSEKGLEGLTTKSIAKSSGVNEVYIYRYFLDKDDLLIKTYVALDMELFNHFIDTLAICQQYSGDYQKANWEYLKNIINFFISDTDKSLFYIRMLYSSYSNEEIQNVHQQLCEELLSNIEFVFKDDCDLPLVAHSVFSIVLSFVAGRALSSEKCGEKEIESLFMVLTNMLKPYVKDN